MVNGGCAHSGDRKLPRKEGLRKDFPLPPTSGLCRRHPFHNQGSSHWASREQLFGGWRLERQEEIHRPQPTQDIQEWYTRYPVEWSQEKTAGQRRGERNGPGQCGSCEHRGCVLWFVCVYVCVMIICAYVFVWGNSCARMSGSGGACH